MHPFRQLSILGLLLGALFFAFSLTPSLVPRPFHVQGILSGLSFAAGYWLGFVGAWLWCYLGMPLPRARLEFVLKLTATAICLFVAAVFLRQALEWQNSVRVLMEMDEVGGIRPFSIGLIALLVFVVFLLLARLFRKTFVVLSERLSGHVPHRVSLVLGVAASVVLFWSVIDGVIFTLALRAADNSYQQLDILMQDEVEPPDDSTVTGGADSLISWEALGSRGRRFVTSGPEASELSAFLGHTVPTPLRVYVGLNAAETPEERAQLALQEFKRVGGFERSVVILATPTGRGWVDPAALDTAEYLHRGDIATVTMQYSYLPSPLSLMVEADYGAESARALFKAIYGHWSSLPADDRPRMYLHGLSLGALNSDRSFDVYDIIDDPFDGVLWSGPPFRSETWSMVTRDRDPKSPAWLPQFRNGAVVRFMNQHQRLDAMDGPWGDFRIAFLQYASDPVTFFQPAMLYREPAWMQAPRGPDVSPELRWYPVVTMLQLVADIAAGQAPTGYGHEIAARDYIDAWLALTEPADWSETDLQRLRSRFSH